jgi:hypothetical protein
MKRFAFLAALALLLGGVGQARADLIFSDTAFNNTSSRSGANDPLTFITNVAQNTNITNIGIFMNMPSSGSIQFMIYDITLGALEYISSPQAFAADSGGAVTLKESASFSFTLLAGHQYYIGGVANVANNAASQFPHSDFTQNGITSDSNNGNFTYNGAFVGLGAAGIPLELFGPTLTTATPEPASLTLLGVGAVGLIGYGWRRRRVVSAKKGWRR